MKALELFEYAENKNGTVSITLSPTRTHVNINIDYSDISNYSRMSLNDPNNPELQDWALKHAAKNHPELAVKLKQYHEREDTIEKEVEEEILEMVGAFKALINAIVLEKQHSLVSTLKSLADEYSNLPEYQEALK